MTIDPSVIPRVDDEVVARLAADLCRIPSPSGQEGSLADYIVGYLQERRVDAHLQEVVPGRPNVIARVGRARGDQLVFLAHPDSSTSAGWTRDPFEPVRKDDRLEGGGLTDMKGGLAAMLAAVEASTQLALDGELVFIGAMGHSPLGLGAKYALLMEGPWHGFGIFGQSSDLKAHLANGGSIKFEISLTGRTAHIAKPEEAVDALRGASAIADSLNRRPLTFAPNGRLPDLPRLVIGEFSAGSSPARFPGAALLRGDVRTVPGMTRQTVRRDLLAAIAAADLDPQLSVRARVTHVQEPFVGDESGPLMALLGQAHAQVLGLPLETITGLPTEAFITDAADLAAAGLEAVMYGPAPWRNEPGEWVSVRQLGNAARVYLEMVRLVCSKESQVTTGR